MEENMENRWKIINTYFKDNPDFLVKHHLNSYNKFITIDIPQILKQKNPIKILKEQDPKTSKFKLRGELYIGGKEGNKIFYGKPIIYDDHKSHFMYPNEARLRNMTYGFSIHVNIDVIITELDEKEEEKITEFEIPDIFLGRFPIMLRSNLCILNGMTSSVRFNMGECATDPGGYFIVDGAEKVIVSQEKFADNMIYLRDNYSEIYKYSCEVRSASEDIAKPIRTTAIRIVSPTPNSSNNQIVVSIPNVRKPMPLFIVMRALGIISDKEIIETCILNMETRASMIELFIPSIHDAGLVFNQTTALKYLATFTKSKSIANVMDILANYFLPHIGELNFKTKAYYVGHMVLKLLNMTVGLEKATNRDSYNYKRVELSGQLLQSLFREYYTLQHKHITQTLDKKYFFHIDTYRKNFISLFQENPNESFKNRITEKGFQKAFKGSWGSDVHTKRDGIVQDLSRLSYNATISQLRKCNLQMDDSAKVVGPRLINGSQWGLLDPVDSPDGGNIGLHKHFAISAVISDLYPKQQIYNLLCDMNMIPLSELNPESIKNAVIISINGGWEGIIEKPLECLNNLILKKRCGLIPPLTSISWDKETNILFIYTDGGRLVRPTLCLDPNTQRPEYENPSLLELVKTNKISWKNMVLGYNKRVIDIDLTSNTVYTFNELFGEESSSDESSEKTSKKNLGFIEYIDTAEEETRLLAFDEEKAPSSRCSNMEIHPSFLFGVMGNQIIFPENNPMNRNTFSCGQGKQAISLYNSNFRNRMDKSAIVLNYGQTPIVKSRYTQYINKEKNPYGFNTIVAIMIYQGYNTEDAIIFNEGSIKRGMFNTSYFNSYQSFEKDEEGTSQGNISTRFANVNDLNIDSKNLKPGFDYSNLDSNGIIKEGTPMTDKTVMIGKIITDSKDPSYLIDDSVVPKKGQVGIVDKTYVTDSEEGKRLVKVRIRENRIPEIGDKFVSRAGQKGTCGLIIPEEDMPFTPEGIKPDIIINPHALPTRMTIGQMVECIIAKVCVEFGAFGDCTAFINKGPKNKIFGDLLNKCGFERGGCEVLYNGIDGTQMASDIYIGPTFYTRLKHMVKDKINARHKGPRTLLTRQTVQGRANEGGLRIGEMERDSILGNGMANFLQDSMMTRGDAYQLGIDNSTGLIAIINQEKNLFLSPYIDGPIQFTNSVDNSFNIEKISKFKISFSIIDIPYSCKLLIQELQTMGVQMRLITSSNINQLQSLISIRSLQNTLHEPSNEVSTLINKMIDESKNSLLGRDNKISSLLPKNNLSNVPIDTQVEENLDTLQPTESIDSTNSSITPDFSYYPGDREAVTPPESSPPFTATMSDENYEYSPPFTSAMLDENYVPSPESPKFKLQDLSPYSPKYTPGNPFDETITPGGTFRQIWEGPTKEEYDELNKKYSGNQKKMKEEWERSNENSKNKPIQLGTVMYQPTGNIPIPDFNATNASQDKIPGENIEKKDIDEKPEIKFIDDEKEIQDKEEEPKLEVLSLKDGDSIDKEEQNEEKKSEVRSVSFDDT